MDEKYMRILRSFFLVCIFLFSSIIIPITNGVPQRVDARPLASHEPTNTQQATVSLYTFEKGRTRQYQAQLSVNDATELTTLMVQWVDALDTSPHSASTDHLLHQFLNALHQHWALPAEAMSVINRFTSGTLPKYKQRETVFRASITSSGAGLLVPMFLTPRPRMITLWRADSGKTLVTNYITKFGYNATGPHLGIALGFIGVGFSSRVPNEQRYVLVGGALMTVLFGDNITEIVP